MPHKRAKRSVREHIRSANGTDLPPSKKSIENEGIPKSLSRVLNAAKVHKEWKLKKRKQEEGDERPSRSGKRQKLDGNGSGNEAKKKFSGILPGESLQHYNKRVEDDMRPVVRDAVKTSLAKVRGVQRQELVEKAAKKNEKNKNKNTSKHGRSEKSLESEEDESDAEASIPSSSSKHANQFKEFQTHSSSAPRRLNDIAQAPPDIKRLPKSAGSGGGGKPGAGTSGSGKREGVLSMAQKAMMEEEREKAIARYREMKAAKRMDGASEIVEKSS